ncbi:hypothetical protein DASC09_043500 [Saccharomycopsis crataegensis]|uniref:Metacaspase-1 n=1 Tax=Saccharomycopsis crataegensis TaxID=43959 RepID=A0AAV5QRV2_9ASCO|nr:hypothetical protein DASC09_043500 [Saccharomycopsis crataegensis]
MYPNQHNNYQRPPGGPPGQPYYDQGYQQQQPMGLSFGGSSDPYNNGPPPPPPQYNRQDCPPYQMEREFSPPPYPPTHQYRHQPPASSQQYPPHNPQFPPDQQYLSNSQQYNHHHPPNHQYYSNNQYSAPPQNYSPNPPQYNVASPAQTPRDVPSGTQTFGNGSTFQYSQCSGKRKALIIGCNYLDQGARVRLQGCINDANNIRKFIISQFGYPEENIVILTDDQSSAARRPTKANILRAMQWLVKDARPHDSLFFHFSGHGGVTEDLDGDEEDGFDNTIYPIDFTTNGQIVDDVMHDIMVKSLPAGCRLTALFDSCHSGTALDLPFVYSTKGVIKESNILSASGLESSQVIGTVLNGDISSLISTGLSLVQGLSRLKSKPERDRIVQSKTSPADVVSISGCKDNQTSTDAKINGQATGAMSYAFMKVLTQQPEQSYLSLLNNMRGTLSGKYSQKPQLSSSHPIDVNVRFFF